MELCFDGSNMNAEGFRDLFELHLGKKPEPEYGLLAFGKMADFQTTGEMIGSLEIPTLFVMEGGYDVDEVGINVVNVLKGYEA